MHGIGGVEEDGGRACAAERRGDLLADEARLADAAEHDLALMGSDQLDGLREGAVKARGEFSERRSFGLEESASGVEGSGHGCERIRGGGRGRGRRGGAKVQSGAELLCKSVRSEYRV